jgi:hypothetical protein
MELSTDPSIQGRDAVGTTAMIPTQVTDTATVNAPAAAKCATRLRQLGGANNRYVTPNGTHTNHACAILT